MAAGGGCGGTFYNYVPELVSTQNTETTKTWLLILRSFYSS